jgi:hypothetical protein
MAALDCLLRARLYYHRVQREAHAPKARYVRTRKLFFQHEAEPPSSAVRGHEYFDIQRLEVLHGASHPDGVAVCQMVPADNRIQRDLSTGHANGVTTDVDDARVATARKDYKPFAYKV